MKKGTYRRTCLRCGTRFTLAHFVDKEGAMCTPCWQRVRHASTVEEYNEARKPLS